MITFTSVVYISFAPAYFTSLTYLNSTVYRLGSTTVETHWNRVHTTYRTMYGVLAAVMIMAFLLYMYLKASQKEYWTGRL